MLLERLAAQAGQPPQYDWDAYYRWLFSRLSGREVTSFDFWLCPRCATVNLRLHPARHATCRGCRVTQMARSG